MKNKTCGECRYFKSTDCSSVCTWYCCEKSEEETCCNFELPTNGDRIRSMSDEELANWGMYDLGTCPTFEKHQTCPKFEDCSASEIEQCWLNWLKQEVKDE